MPPRDKDSARYKVPPGSVEASYYDHDKRILVNKLGIQTLDELGRKEEEGLARAYLALAKEIIRSPRPITAELIKAAHKAIFNELYDWAGRWRTVNISKEEMTWPPPIFLDRSMRSFEEAVLKKHPAQHLDTDSKFCEAVAKIQGEFLAVHPFREGNARTIKLCTNLLALQTQRPFLAYDSSDRGREEYIQANKLVIHHEDFEPLARLTAEALTRGRSGQEERRLDPRQQNKDLLSRAMDELNKLKPASQAEQPQKNLDPIRRR